VDSTQFETSGISANSSIARHTAVADGVKDGWFEARTQASKHCNCACGWLRSQQRDRFRRKLGVSHFLAS
jgi:hypothetical protein